jgi:arginine decarboxylase
VSKYPLLKYDKSKTLNRKFIDLICQAYPFPQAPFRVEDGELFFHDIDLKKLIHTFGSPLKLTYLPIIGEQIERSRKLFYDAMQKCDYQQPYHASYCTKSAHFSHVLEEALAHQSHLELSSTFDTDIVLNLHKKGLIKSDTYILCNGYKTAEYFAGIQRMLQAGFTNVIPILDCRTELKVYETFDAKEINIGIRMTTEEDSQSDFYTSRFGIPKSELLDFYRYRIHGHSKIKLKMLHFFVYTGIQDSTYYWNELHKNVKAYVELKRLCPTLDSLNIGGGLPIKNSLEFDYDYNYMISEMVQIIKSYCNQNELEEPALFSEFGSFIVGEAGACIFKVMGTKKQNDRENWYLVDNTLISTLPDMWSKKQNFIMLPINKWNKEYQRAILGGLTCDNDDFYSFSSEGVDSFLPIVNNEDVEPLYVGFFHTGAYQETLSGFGGVHHCLIPSPKHILIDKDDTGAFVYKVFAPEQRAEAVLNFLGY